MTLSDPFGDLIRALDAPGRSTSDFDLNPDIVLPENRVLRPAAVLIPVIATQAGVRLVLTKRSSALKNHPGQIAFPGGKQDPDDADATAAALREAREEIGLPPDIVTILGALPEHETVTGFRMRPILGRVERPFDPVPEPGEVDEVFTVPLAAVTDPARFSVQSRRWRGRYRHYYTVPYGPYYIWGATARILRILADRLGR